MTSPKKQSNRKRTTEDKVQNKELAVIQPTAPIQQSEDDVRAPFITKIQALWIAARATVDTDFEANSETGVDEETLSKWQKDPDFRNVSLTVLENKREGFKVLASHLMPSVFLELSKMLFSKDTKAKQAAATLLMRSQGLLETKQKNTNIEAVESLLKLLRQQNQVIVDTTWKELN